METSSFTTKGKTDEPLLQKYVHVFHEETKDFKSTGVIEHQILIEDTELIRRPQYKTPFALKEETNAQVENVLKKE